MFIINYFQIMINNIKVLFMNIYFIWINLCNIYKLFGLIKLMNLFN